MISYFSKCISLNNLKAYLNGYTVLDCESVTPSQLDTSVIYRYVTVYRDEL